MCEVSQFGVFVSAFLTQCSQESLGKYLKACIPKVSGLIFELVMPWYGLLDPLNPEHLIYLLYLPHRGKVGRTWSHCKDRHTYNYVNICLCLRSAGVAGLNMYHHTSRA